MADAPLRPVCGPQDVQPLVPSQLSHWITLRAGGDEAAAAGGGAAGDATQSCAGAGRATPGFLPPACFHAHSHRSSHPCVCCTTWATPCMSPPARSRFRGYHCTGANATCPSNDTGCGRNQKIVPCINGDPRYTVFVTFRVKGSVPAGTCLQNRLRTPWNMRWLLWLQQASHSRC